MIESTHYSPTEAELKSAHLALLVRVKNLLTPDQQEALRGVSR